ncbi:hypothetical protein MRB53_009135 [Persea americana]|uniref:Uncharacterized protein n=1 Tax=Persea americana TaxID=3435 RepID=A0ACC2LNA3_PERAE|nr:hypothetical protein MRB53_009135 [Persea americana]
MPKAWEDFPEECWEAILDRIKSTQDHHHLESISLVCKRFLSISNRLRSALNVSMRTVLLAPDDLRLTALDLSNQVQFPHSTIHELGL